MEDLGLRTPGRSAFWRDRRVLLTGATGLVGVWVARSLIELGVDVLVFVVDRRATVDDSCHWPTVDLFDKDAIARVVERVRPSHLLHMAWVTEHGRYSGRR